MSTVTMSVHRALAELKLYDEKIEKGIYNTFVVANKVSNKKIGGKTIEEVKSDIQGNFDRMVALLENRKRVKAAIVASNAVTKVSIGGKEYTVANAIERKNSVSQDRTFLNALKSQYHSQNTKVENENNSVQNGLETYLASILPDKANRTPEEIQRYTKDYEQNKMWELVDPCKIGNYIKRLEDEIDEFQKNVDFALSESNAVTMIEVDLAD